MENMKQCGIYLIRNKINKKCYVGLTQVSFERRFNEHKTYLNNFIKGEYSLIRSYKKDFLEDWIFYGIDNFEFKILKILDKNLDRARALKYESIYIIRYNSKDNGYNSFIRNHNESITVRYDIYGENPQIIYFKNQAMHQSAFRNRDYIGNSPCDFEYYYLEYPYSMRNNIPNTIKLKNNPKEKVIMLFDKDLNLIFKTANRNKLINKIRESGWIIPKEKKQLATSIRKFTFCYAQYFIVKENSISQFINSLQQRKKINNKYLISTQNIYKLKKLMI